jgi:D-sedoheptulose 7-phosphate isomerase
MLHAPVERLRRALTFRRLYRCRSCDALFEATLSSGAQLRRRVPDSRQPGSSKPSGSSDSDVSAQRLVEEIGNPPSSASLHSTGRSAPIVELDPGYARATERRLVESIISPSIRESILVKEMILGNREFLEQLCLAAVIVSHALREGHKLFFLGNGGSAAVSQHLAAEFMGRNLSQRPDFPAIALPVNASNLAVIGDDYSLDIVFARQLEALGAPGDVAIGLTASGNSVNVLRAVEAAKSAGLATVGLTGQSGGRLKAAADFCLCVPSTLTPQIHEAHILTGHILCEIVENELSAEERFSPDYSESSYLQRKSS